MNSELSPWSKASIRFHLIEDEETQDLKFLNCDQTAIYRVSLPEKIEKYVDSRLATSIGEMFRFTYEDGFVIVCFLKALFHLGIAEVCFSSEELIPFSFDSQIVSSFKTVPAAKTIKGLIDRTPSFAMSYGQSCGRQVRASFFQLGKNQPNIMRATGVKSALFNMDMKDELLDEVEILMAINPCGVILLFSNSYLVCIKNLRGSCEIMDVKNGEILPQEIQSNEFQFVRPFDASVNTSEDLKKRIIADRTWVECKKSTTPQSGFSTPLHDTSTETTPQSASSSYDEPFWKDHESSEPQNGERKNLVIVSTLDACAPLAKMFEDTIIGKINQECHISNDEQRVGWLGLDEFSEYFGVTIKQFNMARSTSKLKFYE